MVKRLIFPNFLAILLFLLQTTTTIQDVLISEFGSIVHPPLCCLNICWIRKKLVGCFVALTHMDKQHLGCFVAQKWMYCVSSCNGSPWVGSSVTVLSKSIFPQKQPKRTKLPPPYTPWTVKTWNKHHKNKQSHILLVSMGKQSHGRQITHKMSPGKNKIGYFINAPKQHLCRRKLS